MEEIIALRTKYMREMPKVLCTDLEKGRTLRHVTGGLHSLSDKSLRCISFGKIVDGFHGCLTDKWVGVWN